jgi:ankyrin repeat protein
MTSLKRTFPLWLGCVCAVFAAAPGDRRLVEAIRTGRSDAALRLIADGADMRTADARGYTPLHWASATGQADTVRALVRGWPGVSVAAADGATPLRLAIVNGHGDIVRLVLAAGARMDAGTPRLARSVEMAQLLQRAATLGGALIAAIERQQAGAVFQLLAAGAPAGFTHLKNPGAPRAERTAFEYAIESRNLTIVRTFLAHGARVSDDTAFDSCRPCVNEIATALSSGQLEAAKLLLASKPSPRTIPWELIESPPPGTRRPEQWNALVEPLRRRNQALEAAVRRNDLDRVKRLLAEGADPAAPPGGTPVVLAAGNGQAQILRLLLPDGRSALRAVDLRRVTPEVAAVVQLYQEPAGVAVSEILRSIQKTAAERFPSAEAARRITTSAAWLLGKANPGDKISEEYKRSLLVIDELLKEIASSPGSQGETLADAAAELEDKVAHCKALGIGMGGFVQLEVFTRRGEKTVGGWQIFYLLKIYEHAAGRTPERLIGWSSPATGGLEPGRYFFWAVDATSRKSSERVLVRLEGKEKIQLPLAVP